MCVCECDEVSCGEVCGYQAVLRYGPQGPAEANDDLVCLQDGFPELTYEELAESAVGKLR